MTRTQSEREFYDTIQKNLELQYAYESRLFEWLSQQEYKKFLSFEHSFDSDYLSDRKFVEDTWFEDDKAFFELPAWAKINAIYSHGIGNLFEISNRIHIESDKIQRNYKVSFLFAVNGCMVWHRSIMDFSLKEESLEKDFNKVELYFQEMQDSLIQYISADESSVYQGLVLIDEFWQNRSDKTDES